MTRLRQRLSPAAIAKENKPEDKERSFLQCSLFFFFLDVENLWLVLTFPFFLLAKFSFSCFVRERKAFLPLCYAPALARNLLSSIAV